MIKDKIGGHANLANVETAAIKWLQKKFSIKSLVDVGAGLGFQVAKAKELGLEAIGVEGDPNVINEHTVLHDFREGSYFLDKTYDLAYSCEFLEHVQEKYMSNYMPIFTKCKYILITAAPPGWGGDGHVNEQPESYWIEIFRENDIIFNKKYTDYIRSISNMNQHRNLPRKMFLKNRGLFFINERK